MRRLFVVLAAILISAWVASAGPVGAYPVVDFCPAQGTLADLIGLGAVGCRIDDKIFSGFAYAGSASGGPVAMPASGIAVTVIDTPLNPGLRFSAAWAAGPGETMDSLIMYQVYVAPGGAPIKDISARMGGYGTAGEGNVTVAEAAVWLGGSGALLLQLNGGLVDYAELGIGPPTMGPVVVVKDIAVNGNDGVAVVSWVDNQFSEVPEPLSLLLMGSGLLALGALRWCKKN